jgi:hypothetical protein
MDSSTRETTTTSADAVEFVRFCYRRRRVGWPELYDEMCAVASRGLFRGWGNDELAAQGIGFSLFELNVLAALVSRVQTEEQQRRLIERAAQREAAQRAATVAAQHEQAGDESPEPTTRLRFAGAAAGA